MIALLFLLFLVSAIAFIVNALTLGLVCYCAGLGLSLYFFCYDPAAPLAILL